MNYPSQHGQDKYLNCNYFKSKPEGIFVDVGAHDGKTISNSIFFEKIGWKGLCIEPLPNIFSKLVGNRNCICENYAISSEEGEEDFLLVEGYAEMLSGLIKEYSSKHLERVKDEIKFYGGSDKTIKVKTTKLQTLLDKHSITKIDYLSIDTEGNELKVLQSIDYKKTKIFAITIENNFKEKSIRDFLTPLGFTLDKVLDVDEVYLNYENN
jgi:FkbM family methyltransferase